MTVKKTIIVGLTGGIASGKSLVLKEFKKLGAAVIDADEISRRISTPGSPAWKKIVKSFGPAVVNPDKSLNRKELGRLVFGDTKKRKLLERITHPVIRNEINTGIRKMRRFHPELILIDAPLLFEAGLDSEMDYTAVVWAPKTMQVERLKKRDKLAMREISARINSQWPLRQKCRLADFVIDNSGSFSATRRQVKRIWEDLTKKQ